MRGGELHVMGGKGDFGGGEATVEVVPDFEGEGDPFSEVIVGRVGGVGCVHWDGFVD